MHQREVVGVGGVLELDLPVAGEAEAVFARYLHREAATLLHEQVHPLLGRAEEIDEGLDVVLEGGEDHARVLFDAQLDEREVGLVEQVAIALRAGHAAQGAVQGVAPAVVGAHEAVGLALVAFAHGGGTVAAAVEQHVHLLLAVAHHHHGLTADEGGLVAAGFGNLAGVGNPHPGAGEDLVHLLLEDGGIGVEGGMDPVLLHQVGQGQALACCLKRHGVSSLYLNR